ncbi:MAG: hypothetical protein QM710_13095 [Flavobacterium sp.]
MKAVCAFLFLTLISFKGFSQFETPKKAINIAPVSDPKGTVAPKGTKEINYPSIFDKKDKLLSGVSLLKKKEEEEKPIMQEKEFKSEAKPQAEKLNRQLKSEGQESAVENKDFFYGEFNVYTDKIYIACRDNGQIDGDNVSITINGDRIVPIIYLEDGFKKYSFDMKEGVNIVLIEALNTGLLFPNTGQFAFFDGDEKLVTNQNWNLNQGYKAIVRIKRIVGGKLELKKKE